MNDVINEQTAAQNAQEEQAENEAWVVMQGETHGGDVVSLHRTRERGMNAFWKQISRMCELDITQHDDGSITVWRGSDWVKLEKHEVD
ncbi:hypothetical protein [Streptomyces xiamenensis]|uniref:hypothetical protein n=1 Tax=Streptomyces xiamenensis TaxID=408015 RepID=UPI0035D753AA